MRGDKVHVHFIDFGNKEMIPIATAERVDSEFFSIPPLAERFVIAGLFPVNGVSWSPNEYDFLQSQLLNTEVEVEVLSASVTGFPPLLSLLNVDFIKPSPILKPLVQRWPLVPAAQQFAVGKCYTVFITHYQSVLNFWVQDSCEQETLDQFHAALATSVESGNARCLEPKQCFPGILCIARYRSSDQFYRAVVNEIDWQGSGSYKVTFIDYGDSDTLSITDLWPIEAQFVTLPVQATRCCVTGPTPHIDCNKLRSAFSGGCCIYILITAVTSMHNLVAVKADSSGVGQPAAPLYCPPGNAGVPAATVLTYTESSLAEGAWHSVCVSSVEPDGSFYCQLLSDATKLNALMMDLSSTQLLPLNGAVVNGMACVVRSPADGCIYRAHVCI